MKHCLRLFHGHEKDGTLDGDDGCWDSCKHMYVYAYVRMY